MRMYSHKTNINTKKQKQMSTTSVLALDAASTNDQQQHPNNSNSNSNNPPFNQRFKSPEYLLMWQQSQIAKNEELAEEVIIQINL